MKLQFNELSLRRRLLVSQLPLLIAVVVALVITAAVAPAVLDSLGFRFATVLLAALTAACVVVPWERYSPLAYWCIPVLDFAVVGGLYYEGRDSVIGLSFLAVFPVFWMAWSGAAPRRAWILGYVCTTLLLWAPLFTQVGGIPALDELLAPLLIPFVMLGIGVVISTMESDTTAQQKRLVAIESELQASLGETHRRSQLLDAVLETVDVGVMAVDAEGRTILMNSRQRINHALAGLTDGADTGSDARIYGLDQITPVSAAERPSQRAMREESFSDVIVWVGTGERQRALAVCARAMHEQGEFAGSVLAYSDVTEMVNALNAREDFVSSVSHELRTPLTSIIGYLDLVVDDEETSRLPGHLVNALEVAQRNAERLLLLVADLLTTASGTMHLQRSETDVAELVRVALDSARPRATAIGVDLDCDCEAELRASVDPDRISQVLDNLLSNAIKYSPDGGKVTVRSRKEDGNLVLEVEDTGIGMSEADQRDVFTKFFRTGQVKKAAIPGVGLGLVITKSIVEAHGGRISFSSELGAGSTFRVEIQLETRRSRQD
ncbi:cell wall metabolism sensor histidine kinase WalK [Arthrobacter sp. zg-Y859]|uniref:histidine kinase n=1 Tax=Arthrobacter jinronghuae TaxID=2964609 RepID=A0ABT1NWX9_9MICC|nr:ATP-binding protein [Arthrobacter jinronghuae]MCQ1951086.1 cell wall metabolism sensor histidine kinase WalK [Arthrobacter jinronghuae]UWX79537.1 cell wall metabolism sensor histidine kinase WalK [Arthrobacter jinronghuae]